MVTNQSSLELITTSSGETVVTVASTSDGDSCSDVITIGGYQYNIGNADQQFLHMLYKLQHQQNSQQDSQQGCRSTVLLEGKQETGFQDEQVEDDESTTTTKKAFKFTTNGRSRKFWILSSVAAIVFLLLAVVTPVAVHKKRQNICVAGKNDLKRKEKKYLKNARLQFHFEGFNEDVTTSSSSTAGKAIIESALKGSYNRVSGGCNDIYERWMYDAKLVELTTVHDYMADDDEIAITIAHVDTSITCINDCPSDEIFASSYPVVDWPTYRNRARLLGASSSKDEGSTSINAGEVLIVMEDQLVQDGVISGISAASFESLNHGVYKRFGKKKGSKKSKKNACYDGKGNGKGGKGGSKTSSPSISLQPSVSMAPSDSPSVSMEPSRGKGGKGSSKTAAPSLSLEPSQSFAPSCSLMPSTSEQPTEQPSISEQPTELPSLSVEPSFQPTRF